MDFLYRKLQKIDTLLVQRHMFNIEHTTACSVHQGLSTAPNVQPISPVFTSTVVR